MLGTRPPLDVHSSWARQWDTWRHMARGPNGQVQGRAFWKVTFRRVQETGKKCCPRRAEPGAHSLWGARKPARQQTSRPGTVPKRVKQPGWGAVPGLRLASSGMRGLWRWTRDGRESVHLACPPAVHWLADASWGSGPVPTQKDRVTVPGVLPGAARGHGRASPLPARGQRWTTAEGNPAWSPSGFLHDPPSLLPQLSTPMV